MEDTVRQGFICPFCMTDMGDFPRLAAHVETSHPERGDDITDTVVQNFKGLFDKAKRGMMKFDARSVVDISQVNAGVSASVADIANMVDKVQEKARPSRPVAVPPPKIRPELGSSRSHREFFINCRDAHVNESAVLTNTLIIRLDRLINECPNDPGKRKDFEREVVPWSADNESPFCRCCAAKFGLTRRRHHCRLCGRVMCHNCSRYLSFVSARKLTSSGLFSQFGERSNEQSSSHSPSHGRKLLDVTQKTTGKMKLFLEGAVSRMSSDGTEVSLGDLLQQDAEEQLRACPSCITNLQRREQMMEHGNPPALVEQYAALDQLITEVSSLAPNYTRMASSLNNGETMYTLKAAEEMKLKVVQKQRAIDELSQSIVASANESSISSKEAQLRKNIRYVSVLALQGLVSNLISLPSKEQYEKLVEEHRQKIAKQIEEARMRTVADSKILKPSSSLPSVTNSRSSKEPTPPIPRRVERKPADEGWTPQVVASHNPFMEDSDRQHPLREQWEIIRNYLSQAAAAGRVDEVDMLERNLRDLEEEIRRTGLDVN